MYRHFQFALEEAGTGHVLHCLMDVSQEWRIEEGFHLSLRQIRSMKEIVDILYESVSTQEVIYITLVAVTSQMGFGFNRAFFLQVRGERLRGRIGIGPSNHEEAHEIWSRLAARNFPTLRAVYHDLTLEGGVPDPRTQELALRLDFDLSKLRKVSNGNGDAGRNELSGLADALEKGKPARIHASDPRSEIDEALFSLLKTDTVAVVPLCVRGELAAVILADNFITRKPITEAGLNVLKTFSGYVGVALERSRLYDDLRESVAKLQAANEGLKRHQQRLLQAEKLSAVGELAAFVSHEIRNPLVAIGGHARSLLRDPIDDPSMLESLQVIASEVSRLEKFLRETLDFVKPRAVGTAVVDLKQEVRNAVAPFRKEISERGIGLEEMLAEAPVECVTDRELLRHALSNLLKNALEAMEGGGKLFVGVETNGAFVSIRVGDTGVGIPPELRARIFDPFFTTKPGGTGLGLAIASHSIRGVGGRLELESDPRFKTMFRLVLPLEEQLAGGLPAVVARDEGKEILTGRLS